MEVESKTVTNVTPAMAAKAFAEMGSDEQAEFFEELAKETASWGELEGRAGLTNRAMPYGEWQWCSLWEELQKRPEAKRQYMALSVFAFEMYEQKVE